METKICTKCGRELPLDQFHWRDKKKGTRRSECKDCHTGYMKQRYAEKQNIIEEQKAQQKCLKCGESRGYVLDYHHINPNNKETDISHMLSNRSNLKDIQNEIAKCIVLCANCHREFHHFEKYKGITIEDYLTK